MSFLPGDSIRFYVNATSHTGHGHVMRQLAVIELLLEQGKTIELFYKSISGSLIILLQRLPIKLINIYSIDDITPSDNPLVIDDYGLTSKDWFSLNKKSPFLFFYNDGIGLPEIEIYASIYPANINMPEIRARHYLHGSDYRLFRKAFDLDPQNVSRGGQGSSSIVVSVMLGGEDACDYYEKIITILLQFNSINKIKVLTQLSTQDFERRVRIETEDSGRVLVLSQAENLAQEMKESTFSICAAGGGMYEFLMLGVPTIGLIIAANQSVALEDKSLKEACILIDMTESHKQSNLAKSIEQLIQSPKTRALLSQLGPRQYDGLGAKRVVEQLLNCQAENYV